MAEEYKSFRRDVRENIERWYSFYRPAIFGLVNAKDLHDPDGLTQEDFIVMNEVIDHFLESGDADQPRLDQITKGLNQIIEGLNNM